jgi:hypothetical protein
VALRLLISRPKAQEVLSRLQANGYELLKELQSQYTTARLMGHFDENRDVASYVHYINQWMASVELALREIFPTNLEVCQFYESPHLNTGISHGVNITYGSVLNRLRDRLAVITTFLDSHLNRYTDLPQQARLFVEDVDSFSRVRDINPAMVSHALDKGHLARSEDQVQRALEAILCVPFHKKDWGGEFCDLYTSNLTLNGARRTAAFLLKGPGIGKSKEMTIADCGSNGDQIVRLFMLSADVFVIQYVGPIAELVVSDAEGKIRQLAANGQRASLLIIDGQDTARLMLAYGSL